MARRATRIEALGVFLLGFLAAMATSANAQSLEHPRDAAAIFEQATAAGDVAAIAALYAPDAVLLTPDGRQFVGRETIAAIYARNQSVGANRMAFDEVQVDEQGEVAVVFWTWTLGIEPPGKSPFETSGRSVVYWKRFEAGWLIVLDMFQVIPPAR